MQDIKAASFLVLETQGVMITETVFSKNIIGIKTNMTFVHGMQE